VSRRSAWLAVFFAIALGQITDAPAARREALELTHHRLELPGAPAALIRADVNRDGRPDLVIVLAYTEIESIGVDRIEEMIQISTVIPALFERRELRIYVSRADGTLVPEGQPLLLPDSVLAIAATSDGATLLALTDDGVAEILVRSSEDAAPELRPLVEDPPVVAGTRNYFSKLEWLHDVNGDGRDDVILPAADGPAIYLMGPDGLASEPVQRITFAGDTLSFGNSVTRRYPVPVFEDIDADGKVDLVARGPSRSLHIMLGKGDGTFRPLRGTETDCPETVATLAYGQGALKEAIEGELVFFGDLDGSGRAEFVTKEEIEPEKSGMRAGMKHAKRPPQHFRLHRLAEDLTLVAEPYLEFDAIGHSFDNVDFGASVMGLFQDLDGDGRKDLITVTLDFSMFQALKVLTTKRISIGLDFHVRRQLEDGTFEEVRGLDLSEKLKFDLNDLAIGRMAQFAGDFDGDGRIDFVHLGRGTEVTIHRGQPGCRYSTKPDLAIALDEAPQDLGLVRVADLDGDGRADLAITSVHPSEQVDVSPPVRLDLYLSGSPR